MTFKDHFSGHASRYSEARPKCPAALVDALASLAPATRLAWDCGCGNGQLSTLLAARFDLVVATDASLQQLGSATPHRGVDYRCAPAEASGLAGRAVDLTTVAQAAHWFDLPAFYAEVRRVSRLPESVLALISYGRHSVEPGIDAVVERFYVGALAPHWPPERAQVDSGYANLPFPFPRLEVPPLAIEAQWSVDAVLAYIGTWSAVTRLERAGGREEVERFASELRSAWGETPLRRVRWPLTVLAGRVGQPEPR